MQMVGAFAEFERAMLRERTNPVLDAARSGTDTLADAGPSYRFNAGRDGKDDLNK